MSNLVQFYMKTDSKRHHKYLYSSKPFERRPIDSRPRLFSPAALQIDRLLNFYITAIIFYFGVKYVALQNVNLP